MYGIVTFVLHFKMHIRQFFTFYPFVPSFCSFYAYIFPAIQEFAFYFIHSITLSLHNLQFSGYYLHNIIVILFAWLPRNSNHHIAHYV